MCDYIYNANGIFSKLNNIITPTPTIANKRCGCNNREQFTNVNSDILTGNVLNLSGNMMTMDEIKQGGNMMTMGDIKMGNNREFSIKQSNPNSTIVANQSYPASSVMVMSESHTSAESNAEKISKILKVLSSELKKVSPSNIPASNVKQSLVDLISSISNQLINNINKLQDNEIYMIANKLSLLVDHMNDSVEFSSEKMKQIYGHISGINNHLSMKMNNIASLTSDINNIIMKPTM